MGLSGPLHLVLFPLHTQVCICVLSRFIRVRLFVILWTLAQQAPLSMAFSRQEYWSGLPCPPPGHIPDPVIEPASPASFVLQVDSFFYIYKCIHFNWRLITLQYCSSFAIHWHELATSVHGFPILNPLPPPSPSHPSGSSQCTSPEHPAPCIKPRLVIHFLYDITHVSMPFSQIIPPSPSPTESKRLFYTSVLN